MTPGRRTPQEETLLKGEVSACSSQPNKLEESAALKRGDLFQLKNASISVKNKCLHPVPCLKCKN